MKLLCEAMLRILTSVFFGGSFVYLFFRFVGFFFSLLSAGNRDERSSSGCDVKQDSYMSAGIQNGDR